MMKKRHLMISFVAIGIFLSTSLLNALVAQTDASYSPANDSYVRNDDSDEVPDDDILRAKIGGSIGSSYDRKSLLSFDLSGVDFTNKTIDNVALRLTTSYVKTLDTYVDVYQLDNDWIDETSTWGNIVEYDFISTTLITADETAFDWDVTSYASTRIGIDGIISFSMYPTAASTEFKFYSTDDEAKESYWPELIVTSSYTIVPDDPSDLSATTLSTSEIDLAWTDNTGMEKGYIVERQLGTDAFAKIDTVGIDETTYSDAGLTQGTTYNYRVVAYNAAGNSGYSATATATTNVLLVNAPSDLSAVATSSTEIGLTWTDNSADELGFKIERHNGDGVFTEIADLAADVTSYDDASLSEATVYTYRMYAYNAAGDSDLTDEESEVTHRVSSGTTVFNASDDTYIRGGTNSTDNFDGGSELEVKSTTTAKNIRNTMLKFDLSTSGYQASDVDRAIVRMYCIDTDNCYVTASSINDDSWEASVVTWDDAPELVDSLTSTLVDSEDMYIEWDITDFVKTEINGDNVVSLYFTDNRDSVMNVDFNSNESGENMPELSITINNDNLPAPTALGSTVLSDTEASLTWTDNASNELGYIVERLQGIGSFIEVGDVAADVTTFTDESLTELTEYSYRVMAYNVDGVSDNSNEVTLTTFMAAPDAPSMVSATTVSISEIDVAWTDDSDSETGYKVERKEGTGDYAEIADLAADITIYNDAGLTESTEYTYRIIAYNTTGDSDYSMEAVGTTATSLPIDPTDFAATAISTADIDLSWTDNAYNEAGYKIERKEGTGDYEEVADLAADVVSYSDGSLKSSTEYTYRVVAYNVAGNSGYSNESTTTTFVAAILEPTELVATAISTTEIDLTWVDNADNETGFKVERKEGTGDYAEIADLAADAMSFDDTNLTEDTEYTYRVMAYNATDNSNYSNVVSESTLLSLPVDPTSLTATAVSVSAIDLAWTDNAYNEAGYKVERKEGTDDYAEIADLAADAISYEDADLTEATEYTYRVIAYNATGNSAYSNEISETTLTSLPLDPTSLTATAQSATTIDLAWTDNAFNETGYKVERKEGTGDYATIVDLAADAISYEDTDLNEATEYTYRVIAYNATGSSAYSNEASDSTLISLPLDPTSLTATAVSASAIDLAWADSAYNETGYKVERKEVGGDYVEIVVLDADAISYNDTALTAETEYTYRVFAYNTTGVSGYSNEAVDTTLASGGTSINNKTLSNNISVYPNPSNGIFSIDCTDLNVQQLIIMDLSGKVIVSKNQVNNIENVDLSTYKSNVYLIQVVTDTEVLVKKIIVN